MSFWCRLSQCHSVGAKLLIEFDGASAALWNDIRCHRLLPCALILYLYSVSFVLLTILSTYLSVCQDMQTYSMMNYLTDNHTHQFDPGINCGSFAAGYRKEPTGGNTTPGNQSDCEQLVAFSHLQRHFLCPKVFTLSLLRQLCRCGLYNASDGESE